MADTNIREGQQWLIQTLEKGSNGWYKHKRRAEDQLWLLRGKKLYGQLNTVYWRMI